MNKSLTNAHTKMDTNEKYFLKNKSFAQNKATYKHQPNYCTFIFRVAKIGKGVLKVCCKFTGEHLLLKFDLNKVAKQLY